MGLRLSINVFVATIVFWAVITMLDPSGLSMEGFANTFFRMLIFAMIYGAIQVALVVFRGNDK